MKKLLSLLSISVISISSISAVVSCGDDDSNTIAPEEDNKLDWAYSDLYEYKFSSTVLELDIKQKFVEFIYIPELNIEAADYEENGEIKWEYYDKFSLKEEDEKDIFIPDSILPKSDKKNPYSYNLVSKMFLDESSWNFHLDNLENEKEAFFKEMWEKGYYEDLNKKNDYKILKDNSYFYDYSVEVIADNANSPKWNLHFSSLAVNYFLGTIYSNFQENILNKFKLKYEGDYKLELAETNELHAVNILVDADWANNDNLVKGTNNSKLFSDFFNSYVTDLVKEYSDLKNDGKMLDVQLGDLMISDDGSAARQDKIIIENNVNYEGELWRMTETTT